MNVTALNISIIVCDSRTAGCECHIRNIMNKHQTSQTSRETNITNISEFRLKKGQYQYFMLTVFFRKTQRIMVSTGQDHYPRMSQTTSKRLMSQKSCFIFSQKITRDCSITLIRCVRVIHKVLIFISKLWNIYLDFEIKPVLRPLALSLFH